MATGLQKLTGIEGFVNEAPQADAADIQGGPVNPKHAQFGETAEPYSWENPAYGNLQRGPFGPENELLGDLPESLTFGAGNIAEDPTGDRTPYGPGNHGGPMPRALGTSVDPDEISRQLIQSRDLHAIDTNAGAQSLYNPTLNPQQDSWDQLLEVTPGDSMIDPAMPSQLKAAGSQGGFGSHGRENTFARQNSYGFDSRHQHRRYATGSVPGNYMWMKPGGRPMIKSLPGPARPATGAGSPFQGQNTGTTFAYDNGAVLQDSALEYVPPPSPYVAPNNTPDYSGESAPVIDLW
jgi:hypothetical protein